MLKSRQLWFAFVCFLIIGVVGIVFFSPHPIIENPDSVQIVQINYNPFVNQNVIDNMDMIEIESFNSEQILDCLSRYEERLTLSKAKGYWMGDVVMEIIVFTTDGVKDILLGNVNYTYESYGSFKHEIINSDALLLELKSYMALPTSNETK